MQPTSNRLIALKVLVCGVTLSTGIASAQSFNIDFGPQSSAAGVPPNDYGGVAGQTGRWFSIAAQDTPSVFDVNGLPTAVSLHITANPAPVYSDHPGTSGDVAALLDDRTGPGDFFVSYIFTGLEPGTYEIYSYSVDNGASPGGTEIDVIGTNGALFLDQTYSGSFVEGQSYAHDTKVVTDGILEVQTSFWLLADYTMLNGVQLVHSSSGQPSSFCPGLNCPCNNPGGPGEGCSNSTGSGARLASLGTTSVSADDLEFVGHQLLPFQSALLFSGSSYTSGGSGVAFGDGLRCAGGSVVRLGVALPNGSGRASWGPGLASVGGWLPGDLRYFQVWYRDPVSSPCGNGFNLSQGLAVVLQP